MCVCVCVCLGVSVGGWVGVGVCVCVIMCNCVCVTVCVCVGRLSDFVGCTKFLFLMHYFYFVRSICEYLLFLSSKAVVWYCLFDVVCLAFVLARSVNLFAFEGMGSSLSRICFHSFL